jgi:hypothetical protein
MVVLYKLECAMCGDMPAYECGLRGTVSGAQGIRGSGHTASLSLREDWIAKISRNGDVGYMALTALPWRESLNERVSTR